MSNSKKTRFFAKIDGIDRLLFSVQKSARGSITITSQTTAALIDYATPNKYGFSDGTHKEYEDQHYSIHESNEGTATSITKKTKLKSEHQSNVAFIQDTKDYLLWPVFWRRYPLFNTDRSLLVKKSRDTYIQLAEYSFKSAALLYGVFVTRPSFDLSILTNAELDFKTASFENHMVIAIPYFINLPSESTGDIINLTTSPTIINGVKESDHFQIPTKSIPPEKIIEINYGAMIQLQTIYLQRLAQDFSEFGFAPIPTPLEFLKLTQVPLMR
jgi:hypothetical protein